jgi:DNA repair protein RecN (Recombination protein N)
MLQSLHIKDFILIEKLELDFNEGFCAITGETGAGKSILLDAILFCLGEKFSGNPIRPSAESCLVTLVFTATKILDNYLQEIGVDKADVLIIKCSQNTLGRKKFFINDQIVTTKLVQNLFDYLLELHGQHNHTMLLHVASHQFILDEFGKLGDLKKEVALSYFNWQETEKKIKEIATRKEQIDKDIDYLKHVCAELELAQVKKGEEQELADIKRKLQSCEKEKQLIQSVLAEIQESSIERIIGKAQRSISNSVNNNEFLEKVSSNLELAYDKIEDAKTTLQQILRDLYKEEFSIEEIEERLYEIRTLARKHSVDADSLVDLFEKSQTELLSLENNVQMNSEIECQLESLKQHYFILAQNLSAQRKKIVTELEKKVMQELSTLDMKKAIFVVEIESDPNFASTNGMDKVRFVASTNPGMSLSPIDKIASGGELSRFMLAFRVALFDKAPKHTVIFDEIDVGISGSVADSIGLRLKLLSSAVQIIVITHQPQVAGKADQHILVEKTQHDLHTVVEIRTLDEEARSYELARMISGKEITETGLKAAKELITLV